ncbi:MAG TPA: Hsp20/alpha crystallin family protein [Thermoplasmatales archaeon]|nr:Hsp20/alpha crystallin family protein [Thermoplasmatales archaeon]
MNSFRRDRRKRNPFRPFGIDDDFFERFFDERLMEDIEKMAEELFRMLSNAQPGKPIVRGFKLTIGPDGRPKLEEFGHRAIETPDGEAVVSEEREPLTDIIEGDEEVAITVELPGVEKEDIDLEVTEDTLEIKVNNSNRKYHKLIDLPCKVKPKTTKATYKNGVLDIVIKRKEKKREGEAYHVSIE